MNTCDKLIEIWRVRNSNRASLESVMAGLRLQNLTESQMFLVKNTFEIAPYQGRPFKEWVRGFENRYTESDLVLMESVWEYSLIEFISMLYI